jgi:hypothetical protein
MNAMQSAGSTRPGAMARPPGVTNPFTAHPHAVGESYGAHARAAAGFGAAMVLAGLACIVHAVFPFLFVRTGSSAIRRLNAKIEARGAPQYVSGAKQWGHQCNATPAQFCAASQSAGEQPSASPPSS